MKNYLFIFLALTTIVFSSCNKDEDIDDMNTNAAISDCTYLKLREGSRLVQKLTTGGTSQEFVTEVTGSMAVGNTTVAVAEDENGNTQFLTCDGETMSISAEQATTLGGVDIEDLFITFDLSRVIDEEYEAAEIVVDVEQYGVTVTNINRYVGKVIERGQTLQVEGNNYTDVVRFDLNVFTSIEGYPGEFHTVRADYYFAPEVGVIRTDFFDLSSYGDNITHSFTLVSYEY